MTVSYVLENSFSIKDYIVYFTNHLDSRFLDDGKWPLL